MSPHIQFELDAQVRASTIATAAKIERQWVLAGLVDMWSHCFRERTNVVSDAFIEGFFSAAIGPILAQFGIVERIDDEVWRVKGTDRYDSIPEQRRQAGKRGGLATQAKRRLDSSKSDEKLNDDDDGGQANEANARLLQANVKQTSSKRPFASSKRQANVKQTDGESKQNEALYPRSENLSPLQGEREIQDTSAPTQARAGARAGGAEAADEGAAPVLPVGAVVMPTHDNPWGLGPKSPEQMACEAFRWSSGYVRVDGQNEALLAWARASGRAERKLRLWLETRHGPYPDDWGLRARKCFENAPPAEFFL